MPRTQESYNRWRTIHSSRNYRHFGSAKWIHMMGGNVYNAYPIYDWKTSDIWIANGKFRWGIYNQLYDLYYQAGILWGVSAWRVRSSHRPCQRSLDI